MKEKGLNALETEKLVQDEKHRAVKLDQRGSHAAERFRYKTAKAMVLIQFRRGSVSKRTCWTPWVRHWGKRREWQKKTDAQEARLLRFD